MKTCTIYSTGKDGVAVGFPKKKIRDEAPVEILLDIEHRTLSFGVDGTQITAFNDIDISEPLHLAVLPLSFGHSKIS